MKKLYVTAKLKIHPDDIKEATHILNILVQNSMAEHGCSLYQILASTSEDNVFTTFEVWDSQQAEQQHWQTDELKTTLEQLTPLLLEGAVIEKYHELLQNLQ